MHEPLLPFIMAGDPSLEALPEHLRAAQALGLRTIELGLPHSDPIADGPVLQAAAQRAIARGVTPLRVLSALKNISASPDIVLFSYLNPLLQIGIPSLLALLRDTPVKSLLIVDLPFGEEPKLEADLRDGGYPLVPLLAPTTPLARARELLAQRPDPGPGACFAQRFVYAVARLGVTGQKTGDLHSVLARQAQIQTELQRASDRPLAVGFGLSDAASMQAMRAQGLTPIVGSALVQALHEGQSMEAVLAPWLKEEVAASP